MLIVMFVVASRPFTFDGKNGKENMDVKGVVGQNVKNVKLQNQEIIRFNEF